jgi:uncharacterized repeat protein (TIGR01451 family)
VKLINTTVAGNTLTPGARGGNGGTGGNGGQAVSVGGNAGNGGNAGSASGGQGAGLYSNGGSLSLLNATVAYNTIAADVLTLDSTHPSYIGAPGIPGNPGTPGLGAKNNGTGHASGTGLKGTVGSSGLAATSQGGGLYVSSGSTTLENTIIVLDSVGTGTDNDVAGAIASGDHDLIGDSTGVTFTTSNGDSIGQYSAATLGGYFNPLTVNIGPTPTITPTPTSPIFGVGDASAASTIAAAEGLPSATDQRGVPRLYNGNIDLGAVQSGFFVLGSATPNPVTAGNNITYTLTAINGGPSTVSNQTKTLSDTLPANATFVSFTTDASGANWTFNPLTTGATGTVTATISSFTANSAATFKLVVQVNPSTAGGTVIANNASLSGVTQNPLSVTVNTTVAGSGSTNITPDTSIQQTPLFRLGPLFVQLDLVTNTSSTTFNGPVDLVITGLPPGVTLLNASGTVTSGRYAGDPYIQLVGAAGSFKPGEKILVPLIFYAPGLKTFTFGTVVIEGS